MTTTDTARWQRMKALFVQLMEIGADRRDVVLAELCPDDVALRDEVRGLLDSHGETGKVDEIARWLEPPERVRAARPVMPARIGRYDVVEKIGEGGMGVVYKVWDADLSRFVAVKLLATRPTRDDDRSRLLREARAVAALDHPSIATVYEVGESADGEVFLAMAFYEGETLQAHLSRGPLPLDHALRVARQIASGLAAAHGRGITHCDLKPANVMLTAAGAVKLLDFGIASVRGDDTRTSSLVGTLACMAPEQLRGETSDSRIDVWAFGLMLHEMLTGTRPSPQAPLAIAEHELPPPSASRPEVPAALDALVRRALARNQDERYRDGSELVAALENLHAPPGRADSPARIVRLPAEMTRFFGREREIAEISERLQTARLLTLTGPGGIGKTRLAQHVAAAVAGGFAEGVAFVPLAAISDPGLVCSEVARVLGVPEQPSMSAVDALIVFFRERRVLLVLDTFEHVVLAAGSLSRLLSECADLRVLVTSRVPLKLVGEHEYPVLPLPHAPDSADERQLEQFPATALFLDRLRAVRPRFVISQDEAAAIAELCRLLDGLPLAIELAAVRAKLFSPRAILARIGERLDLLSSKGHDRPTRHQSLRHAIAWSYDLLQADEQTLLRLLAVFMGGAGLDAVEAIARGVGLADADVATLAEALVDHSLLVHDYDPDGLPRFRLLDTIREFALDRLHAAREGDAVRRAHTERFLALAEQAAPQLTGPDQGAWFDRLEREQGNFRAALAWVQTRGDAERAMRFGAALWRFWAARGHLREGRERLEQLLAMPGAGAPTLLRARTLHGAATLIHEISEYARARPLADEAVAIARAHGDRELTAVALNNLAWLKVRMGDADADVLCEEGLALNRHIDNRRGIAIALHNLGWLATIRDDFDRACALNEESLTWRRAHGDPRGIAYVMTDLAWAEMRRGARSRAAELLDDARRTLEGLGDRQLLAWTLAMQGLLERLNGRHELAIERFEMSIERWRGVGNIMGLAFALVGDAECALDHGAPERARRNLDEAVPLLRRSGECAELAHALRVRARLAEAEQDVALARGCYEESLALVRRLPNRTLERDCEAALQRINDTTYERRP